MAYTIISQNNSTTTLSDGVNTITVPSRVNLTSGNFTIVEVNNNMATLEDGDGNVYRDIPCVATLVDAGGGDAVSSVNGKTGTVVLDAKDVHAVPQYTTMPTADSTNVGEIAQFAGTTDATYTNGYIYENVATTTSSSATASQTTGSSLSDVAVVLATFETQITTSGSYAFTSDGTNWSYDGNTVDLTDYGITYTGTPVADDVITVVYTESSTTYAWTRIDVQPSPSPLPSQTGNAGKFLTTDGTDASWSDKPLVNTATNNSSLTILGYASSDAYSINIGANSQGNVSGVAIGHGARNFGSGYSGRVAIGHGAYTSGGAYSIAIGYYAKTGAANAIQLNATGTTQTNSDANTVKIGNANGNFEIMSADGTIPTARLTNAINKYSSMPTASADYLGQIAQFTGTTDATYTHGYIYECVSDGGNPATYSWTAVQVQAGGGGGLQNTATGTDSLTILGTASAYSNSVNIGYQSDASAGASVAIGEEAQAYNNDGSVVVGYNSRAWGGYGVAIGWQAESGASMAIQLGNGTNSDANTLKVGNTNGNYEMMDANGNLPADRLASTTGLADGNYKLRLTMSNGTPTLTWVAE